MLSSRTCQYGSVILYVKAGHLTSYPAIFFYRRHGTWTTFCAFQRTKVNHSNPVVVQILGKEHEIDTACLAKLHTFRAVYFVTLLRFAGVSFLCVCKCIRGSHDQSYGDLDLILSCYELSKFSNSEPYIRRSHRSSSIMLTIELSLVKPV